MAVLWSWMQIDVTVNSSCFILLMSMRRVTDDEGSCTPDIMLLYELVADNAMMDILPINTLRNYAAMQV